MWINFHPFPSRQFVLCRMGSKNGEQHSDPLWSVTRFTFIFSVDAIGSLEIFQLVGECYKDASIIYRKYAARAATVPWVCYPYVYPFQMGRLPFNLSASCRIPRTADVHSPSSSCHHHDVLTINQ